MCAMTHTIANRVVPGHPGSITRVFVGPPYELSDELLEVLVTYQPVTRRLTVFHAMPLTDTFRYLVKE